MERMVAGSQPPGTVCCASTRRWDSGVSAAAVAVRAPHPPEVQVQLQLTVDPPPLTKDAFDVCLHFGEPPDARVIARLIAPNRRLLCASPAYLAKHGTREVAHELARRRYILS